MITHRKIDSLPPKSIVWDSGRGAISGFGARRQLGTAISYVLKYRTTDGRPRWYTIGRHGSPWTPDMARAEAKRILGEVAKGGDPAAIKQEQRSALTVGELCDEYFDAAQKGHGVLTRGKPKKSSTLITDSSRIRAHIVPNLGHLKVASITRKDIERFRDILSEGSPGKRACGGRGTATRTMGLLGAIFSYAIKKELCSINPVHGVERHAYRQRDRRVSDKEYAALGEAMRSMPATTWPIALVVRFNQFEMI
jgi:Arm DNA-binding domain/Phage integrase, N-terminal SAM-like domain